MFNITIGYTKSETKSIRPSFWIDMYRGEPIDYEEIIDDIINVQVIFLGEVHTIKRHHELQEGIIKDLIGRGKSIILGLEQMEVKYQNDLDCYNRGEIDFNKLVKKTNWSKRWSNYREYQKIIELVHQNKGLIIALNADSDLIRKIGHSGLKELSKEERKQLPAEIDLNNKDYEKFLKMLLKVHAMMDPEKLHPVYEAQVTRDEMMSQVIARYIRSNKGEDKIIVVLGGSVHFSYGLGIPDRLHKRIPSIKDRIILFSESGDLVLSPTEKKMMRKIEITHEDLRFLKKPISDYLNVIKRKK